MISDWLELDSPNNQIRRDSEIVSYLNLQQSASACPNAFKALLQEISYASYLNLYSVILPSPKNRSHVGSYARAINAALSATANMQLSIRIPLYSNKSSHILSGNAAFPEHLRLNDDFSDAWEMWDSIRTICAYHSRLSLSKRIIFSRPTNTDAS
jgi:protein arginine N-methyltransferase 5